jgi:kinesin family protein 11
VQTTAKSVRDEADRIIDEQVIDLDVQMQALDHFVAHARSENDQYYDADTEAIQSLFGTVELSYRSMSQHFENTFERARNVGDEMNAETCIAERNISTVKDKICAPLTNLREEVMNSVLREYEPTGDTPRKVQYQFPNDLPKTGSYDIVVASMHDDLSPSKPARSLTIFSDTLEDAEPIRSPTKFSASLSVQDSNSLNMGLWKANPNLTTTFALDPAAKTTSLPAENTTIPTLKMRSTRGRKKEAEAEGRENIMPDLSASTGPRRKSARLQ